MIDKNGKGFPSWSQMDDTGKGMFVMLSICGSALLAYWVERIFS